MALSAVVSKTFTPGSNEIQAGYLREALFGLLGAMLYEQANETNSAEIDADVSGAQTLKRGWRISISASPTMSSLYRRLPNALVY